MDRDDLPSTRPYLIRALHEWCTDNGFTPYLAVAVDSAVQVPREFVKDGEIVLNTSIDATSQLVLGNDFIGFKARFGGKAREVIVPVDHVLAIYARENGQGMAFSAPQPEAEGSADGPGPAGQRLQVVPATEADGSMERSADDTDPPTPPAGRPALRRVK